jgi:hypothetical protein
MLFGNRQSSSSGVHACAEHGALTACIKAMSRHCDHTNIHTLALQVVQYIALHRDTRYTNAYIH